MMPYSYAEDCLKTRIRTIFNRHGKVIVKIPADLINPLKEPLWGTCNPIGARCADVSVVPVHISHKEDDDEQLPDLDEKPTNITFTTVQSVSCSFKDRPVNNGEEPAYMSITNWENGEGFQVDISGPHGSENFNLTYERFHTLIFLANKVLPK